MLGLYCIVKDRMSLVLLIVFYFNRQLERRGELYDSNLKQFRKILQMKHVLQLLVYLLVYLSRMCCRFFSILRRGIREEEHGV